MQWFGIEDRIGLQIGLQIELGIEPWMEPRIRARSGVLQTSDSGRQQAEPLAAPF